MVQWLSIHLPRQGTRVQSLVREDPTCQGAANRLHLSYLGPVLPSNGGLCAVTGA